jgi:hypothetical protein
VLTAIWPASRTQIRSYDMMVRRRSLKNDQTKKIILHVNKALTSDAQNSAVVEFARDGLLYVVIRLVIYGCCIGEVSNHKIFI